MAPPDDSKPIQCSVKKSRKFGQCDAVFTPAGRGSHQLHVKVQNTNVKGSPVVVPVSVPPEERGNLLMKTITGLSVPTGIAVTEEGLVVVSEWGKNCITVLNKEWEEVRSIGGIEKGSAGLEDPLGIAISHKGTILVVDGKNCSIREFTLDGKETQCIHPEQSGLVSPTDIAVNRNIGHVYIVDEYINTVTVLNPDLTFSHIFPVFETEPFGGPVAIAIDSKGLVYIAEYYNYRILKFTPEGQFVSSFTTQGAGPATIQTS